MPEDFNAPKIEKTEQKDGNKSERDASHELSKSAYDFNSQNTIESKLLAKSRNLVVVLQFLCLLLKNELDFEPTNR